MTNSLNFKILVVLMLTFFLFIGCTSNEKALVEAVNKGDKAKVQSLLDKGVSPNVTADDGKSVLMLAAYRGDTEIAKMLIDKGADVNAKDNTGKTALMIAAEKGDINMAKLLIENGADLYATDNNGKTALNYAEAANQKEMVAYLKSLMKIDEPKVEPTPTVVPVEPTPTIVPSPVVQISKEEALLQAVKDRDAAKVSDLLDQGADANAKDSNGKTALMYAAENGDLEIVKLLVEKGGAEILSKDNRGKTAIMYAVDNNHNDVAKYLMQKAGIKK